MWQNIRRGGLGYYAMLYASRSNSFNQLLDYSQCICDPLELERRISGEPAFCGAIGKSVGLLQDRPTSATSVPKKVAQP